MWKVAIKYAVVGAVFESVLFHVGRTMDIHPLIDLRHLFFDILLLAVFITLAAYEYKRYVQKGLLHFWQGMSIGFLVYVPVVILMGGFLWFYFDEGMVLEYKELAVELLEQQKSMYVEQLGEAVYLDQYEQVMSISKTRLLFSALIKKLVIGFFVTPAISIALRKKPV